MTTKINPGYRKRKRGLKYTTVTVIFTKTLGNNNDVKLYIAYVYSVNKLHIPPFIHVCVSYHRR